MKKYLSNIILFIGVLSFIACGDDIEEPTIVPSFKEGAYILNEYNPMNGELSRLSYYDKESGTITDKVFFKQNNTDLGVGAQDILTYGSKMYISVTTSDNICVTDLNAKLLKYSDGSVAKIKSENIKGEALEGPRSLVAHGDYVYASYYSGHIAKIDTATMKIIDVTPNTYEYKYLEEIKVVDNKLYTIETRDKRDRVAILNLDNFKLEAPVKVAENPLRIASDNDGNIYTLSSDFSAYPEVITTLTQIKGNKVIGTVKVDASEIVSAGNELVLMNITYGAGDPKFSFYDINTGKLSDKKFTTDNENLNKRLQNAFKINVDPTNQDFYVTVSKYGEEGEVFVFDKDRKYKNNFSSGGQSPNKVHFITKQQ